MRKFERYQSTNFKGIVSQLSEKKKMLILLHGVGANEEGLLQVGEAIQPESVIVSLRAPLILGSSSFAWFHVQFTPNGPVHNWPEADSSFVLLENEIKELSRAYQIPLSEISVMGFSQGSIMTMGLALKSQLQLSRYYCFSGRTLPEFAEFAQKNPEVPKGRKVFLTHGSYDEKLPVQLAHKSKQILENVKADLSFVEFPGGHQISENVLKEAATWAQR